MITVIVGRAVQELVGGESELEVDAKTIGRLVKVLDQRYPGFRNSVIKGMRIRSSIDFSLLRDNTSRYGTRESIKDLHRRLPDGATIIFDLRQIMGG